MSGKGSISRMSDECLMTQEFGFPFYTQYQAVTRKFTLAEKSVLGIILCIKNIVFYSNLFYELFLSHLVIVTMWIEVPITNGTFKT